jgi:hypothetical protein
LLDVIEDYLDGALHLYEERLRGVIKPLGSERVSDAVLLPPKYVMLISKL